MNNFKRLIESVISEARPAGGKQNPNTLKIVALQKKHGYSWAEAEKIVNAEINAAEKEIKKKIAAEKRKNRQKTAGPKEKVMTDAQFYKKMKAVAADFQADFAGTGQDIGDVAWDIAGSLIYDPEVENYVRRKIAKNTGRSPESIRREIVIEFIADTIV